MDESEIDRIYSQQLHDELQSQTKTAVTQLIELYPEIFGLDRLIAPKNQYIQQQNLNEAIAQTVRDTCLAYIESGVDFDHALVRKKEKKKKKKINTYTNHLIGLGTRLETTTVV